MWINPLDSVDNYGWTILHEAILGESVDIVKYITKTRPVMKFMENKDGRTPLHLAAFCDSSEIMLKNLLKSEDTMQLAKYKDVNGRSIGKMALLHSSQDWGEILTGLGDD
jgi:ankyrin repeat protein